MNKIWKGLLGSKIRPLNEKESQLFLGICMKGNIPFPEDMAKELESMFLYQVLKKRLDAIPQVNGLKPEISPWLILWCSMLCDRPGIAVMWAYTLYLMWLKERREVTIMDWVDEFPMGVPLMSEYERLWDEQKQQTGIQNCMDDLAAWPKVWPEDVSMNCPKGPLAEEMDITF